MVCGSRVLVSVLALWYYILAQHIVFASSNSSIYTVQQQKKQKVTNLSRPRQSAPSSAKSFEKATRRTKPSFQTMFGEPYSSDSHHSSQKSFHRSRHRHGEGKDRLKYAFAKGAQSLEPEHHASELVHFHQPEAHSVREGFYEDGSEYVRPRRRHGFTHRLDFFGVENPWALFGMVASMLLTLPILKAVVTFPLASIVSNIGRLVYLAYLNRNGTRVLGFRDNDFGTESQLIFDNIRRIIM